MKAAYYIKKRSLKSDSKLGATIELLRAGGLSMYEISAVTDLQPDTDMLICFGGDGTFLTAAQAAYLGNIPILGVNLGRMGFLAGAGLEEFPGRILEGRYVIEERPVIFAGGQYAFNEVVLSRKGTETIGVDLSVNGVSLPTYWADGLLIATTSGSTAYNLGVGGPICMPGSGVFVVSPIAPHNLGVRPLVIPDSSSVRMTLRSRHGGAIFSCDNRSVEVPDGFSVDVCLAERSLKCVVAGGAGFIDALRSRLFWGMDVRNTVEQ